MPTVIKPLILSGDPVSTNSIYKTATRPFPRTYMTHEGKALKESYQWEAKSQWKEPILDCPVEIEVRLYFATKRLHDVDNYNKLLYDALTGIVWVDDNQIQKVTTEKFYDKGNARIEISIQPYGLS